MLTQLPGDGNGTAGCLRARSLRMWIWQALGWLLVALEVWPILRQRRHIEERDTVAGVSVATHFAWALSWGLWVLYGSLDGLWPVAAQSVINFVPSSFLAFTVLRRGFRLRDWLPTSVLAAGMALVMIRDTDTGLLLLLGFDLVFLVPQVVSAWRAGDLRGLSKGAYRFSLVTDVLWIVYAAASGAEVLSVWFAASMMFNGFILWRLRTVDGRTSTAPDRTRCSRS
jgi:uncharacterized protein with PQ loop repeat